MSPRTIAHHRTAPVPRARVQVRSVPAHPRIAVIRLHGDIDLDVAPALRAGLTAALHRRAHLLVDLADVGLLDCASLGLLVRAHHTARQNNTVLALVAAPALVRLTLRATRLAGAFPAFSDLPQALAALAAAPGIPGRPRSAGRPDDRRRSVVPHVPPRKGTRR